MFHLVRLFALPVPRERWRVITDTRSRNCPAPAGQLSDDCQYRQRRRHAFASFVANLELADEVEQRARLRRQFAVRRRGLLRPSPRAKVSDPSTSLPQVDLAKAR